MRLDGVYQARIGVSMDRGSKCSLEGDKRVRRVVGTCGVVVDDQLQAGVKRVEVVLS